MSERLTYRPVGPADLDLFHGLVQDEHVRRYLMDGELLPREWSEAQVSASGERFRRLGVGLWLAHEKATGEVVGFCGFIALPGAQEGPELVYALPERFTGRGLGTEMARASIAHARAHAPSLEIVASVDEVNAASVRILEKLGFVRTGGRPGAFGNLLLMRLR